MAVLSITAAEVQPGADADYYDGTAGEAVTAGQAVYLATADNRLYKADADIKASAKVKGIALHGASAGQPLRTQTDGTIVVGASASVPEGTVYFLSSTAGGIGPFDDLAAGGMYGTYLGVGDDADGIALHIHVSNTLLAAVV